MNHNIMSSGDGGGSIRITASGDNYSKPAVIPRCRVRSLYSSSLGFLFLVFICPLLTTTTTAATSPTGVAIDAIAINDVATGIEDIMVIHNNRDFAVLAELVWEEEEEEELTDINMNVTTTTTTRKMVWKMLVDDVVQDSGEVTLVSLLAVSAMYM